MKVTFALLTLALAVCVIAYPDGAGTDQTAALEAPATVVDVASVKSHAQQHRSVHLTRRRNFDFLVIETDDLEQEFHYGYDILEWVGVMNVVYDKYADIIDGTQTPEQQAVYQLVRSTKIALDRQYGPLSVTQHVLITELEKLRDASTAATGRAFFETCLELVKTPTWIHADL
ncbi:hypothetical protein H4R34_002714 [Dimargaris verticillata]|uniref:Uncharacterized protein n=1 Tax=Dimargaris verticillata TaxID=2761393 RepID=A0A9W8B7M1_9FUNG|nr:hypothetical protein H4R34_002714 [Dimargaris verticillata]